MRVTNRMLVDTVVNNLQHNVAALERIQRQISSGKRVNRPAEDPTAAALGVRFRHEQQVQNQFLRNIEHARSWLAANDLALEDVGNALARIRELLVQAVTDSYSAEDRYNIGREIEALRDQILASLNSTMEGDTYLFSGTKSTTAPFRPQAQGSQTIIFEGNDQAVRREIGPGTYLQVNVPGSAFLTLFGHLETVINATADPNTTDLAGQRQQLNEAIGNVDQDIQEVLLRRATVGAKINRLEFTQSRMESLQIEVRRLQSSNEDLDFAEALTRLTTQQGVYRAALEAGARTAPMSILDFLR